MRSFLPSLLPFSCGTLVAVASMATVFAQDSAPPSTSGALPQVVAGPPGADAFRELFEQPDGWATTRPMINELLTNDHSWNQISPDDAKKWLAQLQAWNIKLGLEVGAVKEWGGQTGKSTFDAEKPGWDRIIGLGATINSIAQDEPLCCVRFIIKKDDDYALNETASFISLVRQNYPNMLIGDIEPYPSIPTADHIHWIDALQAKLASLNVKGLDFYRVDVDWNAFDIADKGLWPDVLKIQQHCKSINLPFSLIYWAANMPFLQGKGIGDDSTWYTGVMSEGYAYASIRGRPDQFCIESWVGAPAHSVPDNDIHNYMCSVRDFVSRFVNLLSQPVTEASPPPPAPTTTTTTTAATTTTTAAPAAAAATSVPPPVVTAVMTTNADGSVTTTTTTTTTIVTNAAPATP